jgi:hypothetical protein
MSPRDEHTIPSPILWIHGYSTLLHTHRNLCRPTTPDQSTTSRDRVGLEDLVKLAFTALRLIIGSAILIAAIATFEPKHSRTASRR